MSPKSNPAQAAGNPPPRPNLSVLGQTSRFYRDPIKLLRDTQEECGDVFELEILGMGKWIFFCSPEASHTVFRAAPDTLLAGKAHATFHGAFLGYDALATLDGSRHYERRRMILPALNGRPALRHLPTIHQLAVDTIERMPTDSSFSLLSYAHRLSLEVMVHVVFESKADDTKTVVLELFDDYMKKTMHSPLARLPFLQHDLGGWSPWGKILRLRTHIRQIFLDLVQTRRRHLDPDHPEDLLAQLLVAEHGEGAKLDDESIVDELLTLLFTGHETPASLLTWIFEHMLDNPDIEREMRDEVERVLGDEPIRVEHLRQLPYLDAVVQEGLRIAPIAPLTAARYVEKPFELCGYTIESGRTIAHAFHTQVNRDDIFPDPGPFDPKRFLERDYSLDEWAPFGGGRRLCTGRGLAEIEMTVVLATMLQHLRVRPVKAKRSVERSGIMYVPEGGLELTIERSM
ncbi:MAG: cytochrome P450 [Acidobacteriota bacterium]